MLSSPFFYAYSIMYPVMDRDPSVRAVKDGAILTLCGTGEICQREEMIRRGDSPGEIRVAVQLGHIGGFLANELCGLLVKAIGPAKARLVVPIHGGKVVHNVARSDK